MSGGAGPRTAVVIGFGSIGQRHAALLAERGYRVGVVSRRDDAAHEDRFARVDEAMAALSPELIVVANETAKHAETLRALRAAGRPVTVLVEKPLYRAGDDVPEVAPLKVVVGYNLRFHPALARLRQAVAEETPLCIEISCASYLPDWRPHRDHRQTSSARRDAGGGVLHDLSHELDYLLWLCGDWRRLSATGRRTGTLGIETEDVVAAVLEMRSGCTASIHLDYLARQPRRRIAVTTAEQSLECDLETGRLVSSRDGELVNDADGVVASYGRQLDAVIGGDLAATCGYGEAVRVQHLIAALDTAMRERQWVEA